MIEIDKREIWKAKDKLTKMKTYSARMQYGFDKGIEFALEQVNKNYPLPNVNNSEAVVSCDTCKHNCLVWNDNHPCASCAEFDNFEQKTDY